MSVLVNEEVISDKNKVFRTLHGVFRKARGRRLRELPHQGKTAQCFGATKLSSHFLNEGKFLSFKQWRFIHRVRLGLVPLNANRHNSRPIDKRCRRCGGVETLPYVLNHCMRNSNLYKARHNALLDRLKKAAGNRWTIIGEDQ